MAKQSMKGSNGIECTEMTFTSNVKEWINEIVSKKNFPFGKADVEPRKLGSPKRADIILRRSPSSDQVICVIECKQPYEDVLSSAILEQAFGYAKSFKAPYFCTCNGRSLAWFETKVVIDVGEGNITTGLLKTFDLSQIRTFNHISIKDRIDIQSGLSEFLFLLHNHVNNHQLIPLKGLNEFFVIRLQTSIELLFIYYFDLVEQKVVEDRKFAKQLQDWFTEQGWNFTFSRQDYEVVARQAAYLLINKIILYSALQQHWKVLDKLEIPPDLKRGGKLIKILVAYFSDVLKVDYETIFSTDSIDIGFPESEQAVDLVRVLVQDLNKYNLVNLGYDIIGYIFERLIPKDERHKLGQYFTPAEVVDLMLVFCSRNYRDKILDPAVGAGTCLVRSYQYKRLESYNTTHEDLLELLWGCDIVQFPAHLTAINLAVRGLDSKKNFPRVLHRDFFKITPDSLSFRLPMFPGSDGEGLWTSHMSHKEEKAGFFDVVIGNPPYTRQEYLGDLMRSETYKEDLIRNALYLPNGTKLASLSKRAALHTYFFIHSYKFLKEGGRMAFVTSNSWLNAAYGSGLQEFLLKHFKIIAIIESDKERWFPGVAVDNCIVVLEKCSGAERTAERDTHLVCFVRFHTSLIPTFVSPAMDDEQSQRSHFNTLKRLANLIQGCQEFVQDERIRIYPKLQAELREEGVDKERGVYIGSRWGKFTTAPAVFYQLVEQSHGKLIAISELAEIRYGLKTGANEFFYLTENEILKRGIEQEYWGKMMNGTFIPNYVMKSPTDSETIQPNISNLKLRALLFNKPKEAFANTQAGQYIEEGERQAFNERPTCKSRAPESVKDQEDGTPHKGESLTYGWYDLGDPVQTHILWPELSSSSRKRRVFISEVPVVANSKLYALYPHDCTLQMAIAAVTNSTITDFFCEFASQSYGGFRAPSNLSINEARKLLIPDIRLLNEEQRERLEAAFHRYSIRKLGSLKQEYGVEQDSVVSVDKIQSDLRAMDKIVMGELLGLTDQQQLEIYRTVFELAVNRFNKAKSGDIQTRGILNNGIDEDAFVAIVVANAEDDVAKVNMLYHDFLAKGDAVIVEIIPPEAFRGRPVLNSDLWGYELTLGKTKLRFTLEQYGRALYFQAWALVRVARIQMPLHIHTLVSEAEDLVVAVEELVYSVETYTRKVVDMKLRKKLESRIWNELKQSLTSEA
jgi:type I restriction-modification system DNA methylase subunit